MHSNSTRGRINRRLLPAVVAATVVAALSGCGGGDRAAPTSDAPDRSSSVSDPAPPPDSTPSTEPAPIAEPSPGTSESMPTTSAGDPRFDHDATLRGVSLVDELVVRDAPSGAEVAVLAATTAFGTPTVVSVLDRTADWVHVLVPIRPNDLSGWVRSEDIRLEAIDTEIHIDLASRTLRLVEHGQPAGHWPVAVGRPDRPTPVGQFFITDKLATGDAGSVWGAHAFGISAYSDVLTDFIGGVGQIGVHGTNDPNSIGNAASSGCVRLPNEVIDDLIDRVPLGTPVHIA